MLYESLKNKKEFDFIYKNSYKFRSDIVDVCILKKNFLESFCTKFKQPNSINIIGLSVSKKIGKAVERNLIKRRFRAICRGIDSKITNLVFILIAKENIKQISFSKLEKYITNILLFKGSKCELINQ